ncbi:MAG: hypothetical protein CMG66_01925 [Candidatus Marinimicrobia bacterium]|nr:hypothetical protein [Candidatus Neomarinimicrobiota bacterium]
MNYFKKMFCFVVLMGTLLSQNVELITQKINVENAIRDKVNVTINKLLDQSQYVIIVNARMDVKGFSMLEEKNTSNAVNNDKSYYSPIPGLLPTVPQDIKKPMSNTYNYSTEKYLLYGLDIAIYLEESVASGSLKQNIVRLVNESIPEIVDCDDCIRFETMNMGTRTGSNYQDLLSKIEKLEADKRDAETQILNWKFDELEKQLALSEDARSEWETQARQRERSRQISDSLRMVSLEKIEKEYRKKQDSLYLITSIKLDEAVRGRIESSTELTDKLIDIIKTGMDTNVDKDLLGGGSDIDRGKTGGSGLLWGALGVIIVLLGTVLAFVLKNRKPVYLKPKSSASAPAAVAAATPSSNSENTETASSVVATNDMLSETIDFDKTQANENSDVVRSELKSLRQSAVAMSVSQKDGANQIVQDWLEVDGNDTASADEQNNDKDS